MTQINFNDRLTTKKGNIGEALVDEMLREQGFVIYVPEGGQAHAFDRLAIKNKEILLIAEVKSKSLRKFYPDTGIDIRHYHEYLNIMNKHNLEVIMFFVDEEIGEIYGGKLKEISAVKSYAHNGKDMVWPLEQKGIIYFHRDSMKTFKKLSETDCEKLKQVTSKNINYV